MPTAHLYLRLHRPAFGAGLAQAGLTLGIRIGQVGVASVADLPESTARGFVSGKAKGVRFGFGVIVALINHRVGENCAAGIDGKSRSKVPNAQRSASPPSTSAL